jgi:hypothetical protein
MPTATRRCVPCCDEPVTRSFAAASIARGSYLEIAVLTVALRPAAKPTRLIELIHRAIPYPVLLVAQHNTTDQGQEMAKQLRS